MERSSYLIALSSNAVEGARMGDGEAMSVYTHGAPEGSEGKSPTESVRSRLEVFLDQAQWRDGPAVMVIPTEAISFRRLEFSFSDLKKIRQALPFELESELMDEADGFAYDFEVLTSNQGKANVLVYLLDKLYLGALIETCEKRNIDLRRVTFSAQALVTAQERGGAHEFHLYAGSDETFILYTQDGRLRAVAGLGGAPQQVLEGAPCGKDATPVDRLQALMGLSSNGKNGKTGTPSDNPESLSPTIEEEGPPHPESGEEVHQVKLRQELERIRAEANQFIKLYRPPVGYDMQIRGLFAPYFSYKEGGDLTLNKVESISGPIARPHFGILGELGSGERLLGRRGGINFFRRLGTWMAAFMAFRWQLVTSLGLLFVLVALWGGSQMYAKSILEQRMKDVDTRLAQVLGIPRPINSLTVNSALKKLRDRRAKLLEARQATAYLEQYHYDAIVLLNDVSKLMVELPRLRVETLTYNRERFTITGVTPEYSDSEMLKNRIGALEQFKGREVSVTHSRAAQGILFRLFIQH